MELVGESDESTRNTWTEVNKFAWDRKRFEGFVSGPYLNQVEKGQDDGACNGFN